MSLPDPETGLVIRYAYLWRDEADSGQEEGRKDRPSAIVVTRRIRESGETEVLVVPITHTEPTDDPTALEIPSEIKDRLGLDDERSWVITHEMNIFTWPGPDVRPVDLAKPEQGIAYGFLPAGFTGEVIKRIKQNVKTGRVKTVRRTE